jgi:membrane protein
VEQRWKWLTPGALFAVILWTAASLGFSYYVNNFGSYDKTYGSIGAIIILLTWMYVSGFVILVGGVINAEIEHASNKGKAPGEKTETSATSKKRKSQPPGKITPSSAYFPGTRV